MRAQSDRNEAGTGEDELPRYESGIDSHVTSRHRVRDHKCAAVATCESIGHVGVYFLGVGEAVRTLGVAASDRMLCIIYCSAWVCICLPNNAPHVWQ